MNTDAMFPASLSVKHISVFILMLFGIVKLILYSHNSYIFHSSVLEVVSGMRNKDMVCGTVSLETSFTHCMMLSLHKWVEDEIYNSMNVI